MPASATDTKLSVLSSISATRGAFFASTRREKSGGMVSTPFTRPLRRSVDRLALVRVVDGVDGPRAGRGRERQLADAHRRHAVILIDDRQLEVLDVAAERVAEDDQLHEREHHRHDDQHRAAAEAPQLAFDDRPGALPMSASPQHERAVLRRRFLQRVAQRPARVVHEHVVERRALDRQRLHGDARAAPPLPSAPASSPARCAMLMRNDVVLAGHAVDVRQLREPLDPARRRVARS